MKKVIAIAVSILMSFGFLTSAYAQAEDLPGDPTDIQILEVLPGNMTTMPF